MLVASRSDVERKTPNASRDTAHTKSPIVAIAMVRQGMVIGSGRFLGKIGVSGFFFLGAVSRSPGPPILPHSETTWPQ